MCGEVTVVNGVRMRKLLSPRLVDAPTDALD